MADHERGLAAVLLDAIDGSEVVCHPVPGPPPMPGAQWDELRGAWTRWLDGEWHVLEERPGGPVVGPAVEEVEVPASLAHDLVATHELDLRRDGVVVDLAAPEPVVRVPGAQWNEVAARWERWDAWSRRWIEA